MPAMQRSNHAAAQRRSIDSGLAHRSRRLALRRAIARNDHAGLRIAPDSAPDDQVVREQGGEAKHEERVRKVVADPVPRWRMAPGNAQGLSATSRRWSVPAMRRVRAFGNDKPLRQPGRAQGQRAGTCSCDLRRRRLRCAVKLEVFRGTETEHARKQEVAERIDARVEVGRSVA